MILEGTTSSGAVVPVQVTGDGKVVAEGLQGPEGPQGPAGPEGPPGPAGGYWSQSGQDLYPTDDAAVVNLDSELRFANALYYYASVDGQPDSTGGCLIFSTTPSGSTTPVERMRIGQDGQANVFAVKNVLNVRTAVAASGATAAFWVEHSATSAISAATNSFSIYSNGDVKNTNNSYGALSDIKLKENIVDAKSQWDDIKGLRLVNYNFKAETGAETNKQLGLIAQEVEKVCPGLVGETKDTERVEVPVLDDKGVAVMDEDGKPVVTTEERETGEVTKSVAYSVLYMKAVGALQEAMQRIEDLEAKVTALESK